MKDLLTRIGINDPGYFSSNSNYVIDLDDSDAYNRVFSKLDRSSLVTENVDSSIANRSVSNVMYMNDNFSLNLIADFENDNYKLVVHELKGDN